jgi:membrane protease YdiL (CAAX protease family)
MEGRDSSIEPAAGAPPGAAAPAWPPWLAVVGFFVALVGTLIVVGLAAAIAGIDSDDDASSTFVILATLVQGVLFVGSALFFASTVARPRPWQFGLRRAPLRKALKLAAQAMLGFYLATIAYSALLRPDVEQTVTERLGADEGTLGLILAGIMVVALAPVVEELFFRGFFYRALRSRYSFVAAASMDGLLFGAIHYDFESLDSLLLLPPLAFLGFLFCLVYERTGSIFPVIGMHAFNNALAYAIQAEDGWQVSLAALPVVLVACIAAPRLLPDGPRSLPVSPRGVGPDAQLSLPVE